jgi:uncharacterized protein (DUF2141 family)
MRVGIVLRSGVWLLLVFVPAAGTLADEPSPATLKVHVVDLRNHKGDLIFGVFRQPKGFPSTKENSVDWQVKPAGADVVEFIARLPPGRYAASVLHDENRNGQMDRDAVGIPLEGYGVTNNPKPRFRAARFDEAVFQVPPQGITVTISIQYFH